jgi:putative spermidine/putrescine transport system substrate-binding protein
MRNLSAKLLANALFAVLALATAACGGSAGPTSTPNPGKPESELVYAGPDGAAGDVIQQILNPWAQANGVKLTYISTGTVAQYIAQLQAQEKSGQVQYDVVSNNDQFAVLGRAQHLFMNLDPAIMTNFPHVYPGALNPDVSGKPAQYVRQQVLNSGIGYNPQIFAKNGWPTPTSWTDLLDPRYASCFVPISPASGIEWIPMLNYIYTKNWTDTSITFANLRKIAKQVKVWSSTNVTAVAAVGQGGACITPTNSGRALTQQAMTPATFKFVSVKEGSVDFAGGQSVPKGAPHPIAAQMAINQLLSVQAGLTNIKIGYISNTNLDVPVQTGDYASVAVASQYKNLGLKEMPTSVFEQLDNWVQQYNAIASGG